MRPKSIATVVVLLSGTAEMSSMLNDAAVISCSVVSGGLSETAPTKVVLPTPKPPAIRILSGKICRSAPDGGVGGEVRSARTEPLQEPAEDGLARPPALPCRLGQVDGEAADVDEVADQDPGDAHGDPEGGGDLGDRHGPGAHPDDGGRLVPQGRGLPGGVPGEGDHRLDGQVLARAPGPAARERVDRDDAMLAGLLGAAAVSGHGALRRGGCGRRG